MKNAPRRPSFVDIVADAKAHPAPPAPFTPGLGREGETDVWVDLEGDTYTLANDSLAPEEAKRLVGQGARVVYDACGFGGIQCRLDWLSETDVMALASMTPPTLHPSNHGVARLAEWRTREGGVLIVATSQIAWGERIRG